MRTLTAEKSGTFRTSLRQRTLVSAVCLAVGLGCKNDPSEPRPVPQMTVPRAESKTSCAPGAPHFCGTWEAPLALQLEPPPLERDAAERPSSRSRETPKGRADPVGSEAKAVPGSLIVFVDQNGNAEGRLRGGLEGRIEGAVVDSELRLSIHSEQVGGFLVAHWVDAAWRGSLRCSKTDQSALWSARVALQRTGNGMKAPR